MEVITTPDRVKVVLLSSYGEIQQLVRIILLVCCIEAEFAGPPNLLQPDTRDSPTSV